MPGLFKHQYLLATRMFETYMLTQDEIKHQFQRVVDDYCDKAYPDIRDKARIKLGTSFKESDFPSTSSIKGYFDYRINVAPVPEVNDWRLEGVPQKNVDELRNEIEDSVRGMYNDATRTMFERARSMLEKFYSQAKSYNTNAPGATLRDPTIEQMKELAYIVCDMNITNDPLLDKVGKEMLRDFVDLKGSELRRSAELRDDIADKAKKILAKMSPVKRLAA
jgi:hypothetical protein